MHGQTDVRLKDRASTISILLPTKGKTRIWTTKAMKERARSRWNSKRQVFNYASVQNKY